MEAKRRGKHTKHTNVLRAYGAAVLALALLIIAAFLGPEIAFAVQDGIRCKVVVSASRERLDIASFNTGYETDLYRRLTRFAEGLAEGNQYYVTVQDMELSPQFRLLSDFEKIAQNSSFEMLLYYLNMRWEYVYDAEVTCWKQCVVYGDDFAGGVNFILWYLELNGNGDDSIKLLADGETGEIYGLRRNFASFSLKAETDISYDDLIATRLQDSYHWMLDVVMTYTDEMWATCVILGDSFGGLDIAKRFSWLSEYGYSCAIVETEEGLEELRVVEDWEPNVNIWMESATETDVDVGLAGEEGGLEEQEYQLPEIEDFLTRLRWREDEENRCLNFCYPFGKGELNLRFQLVSEIGNSTLFVDRIFGFPEIYELIPEFMGN